MEINPWVEILVDNMDDAFNKEFSAWPIRYFIAKEGRLLHKTENSIANRIFDQDTMQNFFKRLRSIEIGKQMKSTSEMIPELQITMLHFSSLGNFPDHPTPTPWRTSIFFFLFSQRRRRLKLGLWACLLFALLLPFYLYCF